MTTTETPLPDLSSAERITRAELVAIVKALGLDPDRVLTLRLDPEGIVLHQIPEDGTEDDYRVILAVG